MILEPHLTLPQNRPAKPAPVVSVIVCTRNRLSSLKTCIGSILATCRTQVDLTVELVVVDNGSVDGTSEYLAHLATTSDIAVTFVSESRPGLAIARNTGLKNAHGNVLVFVDDDCELHSDYLRDLRRHYAEGDTYVIRGGRVELGDPGDLPFTIKRSAESARFTRDVHPGGFVLGCNMTMHREVAARIGPFDERFGAGGPMYSAEDTDYLVRAYLLGIPIEYVPDMTVIHRHGRSTRQAVETLHRHYSLGNGGLCMKHIRSAPWLLLHFCWTIRSACRELMGGPRFDPELSLSHWPIVFMNLLGAAKFVTLAMFRPKQSVAAQQVPRATVEIR